MNKKVELLSPAGTLKNLRYAFAYGADAVYAILILKISKPEYPKPMRLVKKYIS